MNIKRIVVSVKRGNGEFTGTVGVSDGNGEATAYTVRGDDTGGKSTCYNPNKQPEGRFFRVGRLRGGKDDNGLGEL